METTWLILGIFAYIAAGKLIVARLRGRGRDIAFALLNLAGFYFYFVLGRDARAPIFFAAYCFIISAQYLSLCVFVGKKGWLPWLAFFTPIFFLVVIRYFPAAFPSHLHGFSAGYFLGISYLAFRTSRLVLEIRNGVVQQPSLWQYVSFCFFIPTMTVGPINSYANFQRGFDACPPQLPFNRCAMRILIGLVKFKFFGAVFNQLSYSELLLDGYYHHWVDLPVAMVFYYLFLYCNFSGFCDMAIGIAGFIGIPVLENFDNPLLSRNMREFWNHWHITLSGWMRDIVFAPLSKFLVRVMGGQNTNHAVAVTVFTVFLLIGIWHGVGWNYALFGLAQAVGVVTVHYYTIFLKKRLGREGFKAYNENPWIHAAAVVITFCYYAATLFLFANTLDEMKQIFSVLRW
ncbi:MAG TPA: MBOAT family O-acyltransferase [Candidatus Sulfotelmatobacter sp.]|jgi:D-alanyl-lipoteichoic acid acyltransferase DltB (MBOAT superfamily)|nr:MBOAT family O-acyltransferase [Candidatus Sulfotelmatobacter sp.]